jgi:hypothetical protein
MRLSILLALAALQLVTLSELVDKAGRARDAADQASAEAQAARELVALFLAESTVRLWCAKHPERACPINSIEAQP